MKICDHKNQRRQSMLLMVEIRQCDLDDGDPGEPSRCPVAMALNRKTGNGWRVGYRYAYRLWDNYRISMTGPTTKFIENIDLHEEGDPMWLEFIDLGGDSIRREGGGA